MAAQIRLTKAQADDLSTLRESRLEVWAEAVKQVEGLPPNPMMPEELQNVLRAASSAEFADTLLRQTLSLIGMTLQIKVTTNDVFEALRSALQGSPANWDPAALAEWQRREPLFRRVLSAAA
ncbi:MAG TPA: hypothetical protein VGH90_11735, partial [Chthoniobacteraceae bacterium]